MSDSSERILVVTSFDDDGFNLYGKRCVETFIRYWPSNATLLVATESEHLAQDLLVNYGNIEVLNLATADPRLARFLLKYHKYNGRYLRRLFFVVRKLDLYDYRYDAYKFAKKVFALRVSSGSWKPYKFLIWLDADCITHSKISKGKLLDICKKSGDLGFLGRSKRHSETGIVLYRLTSSGAKMIVKVMPFLYSSGLFRFFKEYTDSYLFDVMRKIIQKLNSSFVTVNWNEKDTLEHPMINSFWGNYLDHMKGNRKFRGSSDISDLDFERNEPYWKNLR